MLRRTHRHEKALRSTLPAAACGAVLALLGCAAASAPPTASAKPAASAPADPLQRANADFHAEYAAARAREEAGLGASRPYLELAHDKLVLRYRGAREERSLSSARFDAVKDASHVPIAAVSAVLAGDDAQALRALAARMRDVEPAIAAAQLGDAAEPARAVVVASVALLEAAAVKAPSDADLHDFGLRTRADTTKLLQAGCDELLAKLDAAVRALRPLAGDAWPDAVVTIATDHQSRAGDVATQYFERLFQEHAVEGALGEARIVVVEGMGPSHDAAKAMSSHLLDRRLSTLLFDDPAFLQGDVLGKNADASIARLLSTPL